MPIRGRQDGQADHPGLHGGEPLDVAPGVDHRPGRRVPIGLGQRLVGIEALLDPGQLGRDRGRLAPDDPRNRRKVTSRSAWLTPAKIA